jgi:hypothetical protein
LITDPSLSVNNPNNPTHTAGTTFFGQFVDHDMTFDTTSQPGVPTDPVATANERTPSLDLDTVYGGGPVTSPRLYNRRDRAKLRIGFGGQFEDLPRGDGGNAIIPDPRNDENLMLAGLHCAFILFHNNAVDWARSHGFTGDSAFAKARQLTTWHYQWLVLHEFLPQVVGQPIVDDIIRNGRRFYRPGMREGYPRGVPGRVLSGSGTAWCGPPIVRTWPATTTTRSSAWSLILPARGNVTLSTCAVAAAPRDASSAGRPSSTSAMGR